MCCISLDSSTSSEHLTKTCIVTLNAAESIFLFLSSSFSSPEIVYIRRSKFSYVAGIYIMNRPFPRRCLLLLPSFHVNYRLCVTIFHSIIKWSGKNRMTKLEIIKILRMKSEPKHVYLLNFPPSVCSLRHTSGANDCTMISFCVLGFQSFSSPYDDETTGTKTPNRAIVELERVIM